LIDLTGKIAVVTGAASGIGRSTALRLAEAGAEVFAGDIDEAGGAETVATAVAAGWTMKFHRMDIADRASVEAFAGIVRQHAEAPHIIANVAGWDRIQPFMDATPDFMDKVLDINLKGPMNVCHVFLPTMMEVGGGHIVNISSDAGRVGSMGETIYAGAKGGVIAFTKSLAREMARHKITVNCVCPGPTDTPLLQAQPEFMREKLTRAIPFRRVAEPQEIADAVLFFASDLSSYVTGQVISVSGGLTMHG
jgi:2-hydroxycyclohexanecarboxyl-CoA dehydrogenase